MKRTVVAVLAATAMLAAGCGNTSSDGGGLGAGDEASAPDTSQAEPSTGPSTGTSTAPPAEPPSSPAPPPQAPAEFDVEAALATVQRLAGDIGPREATSPGFAAAAQLVAAEFSGLGYEVTEQRFGVPAGNSWGTPVEAGESWNVIAAPAGFDPAQPHLLIGAHLDTVAVAPGAEDNASGVAALMEMARLASDNPTRLPVVLVAFGAEEPRGRGDDMHHFGSQHYVAQMPPEQAANLQAMVSLDRVGVGGEVPVCTGGLSPLTVRDEILAIAEQIQVPADGCDDNRASDHWSFEKADIAVARLGSTPYDAYHSAQDVPSVIDPAQLERSGRLAWAWLSVGA